MVGKVPRLDPNISRVRIKGAAYLYFDSKRQRWIARSYPKGKPRVTEARKRAREDFKTVTQLIKRVDPTSVEFAADMTKNSPWLTRDFLMSNAYGRAMEAWGEDGNYWLGVRIVSPEIQAMLNSISDQVGAMLFRYAEGWRGFVPTGTTDGQVLTIHGPGTTPTWEDPPPSGVQTVTPGTGIDASIVGTDLEIALANIASKRVLGNATGGAAPPVAITVGDVLEMLSSVNGKIPIRLGGVWTTVDEAIFAQTATGSHGIDAVQTGSDTEVALSQIADKRILANFSGGTSWPVATTLEALLESLGTSEGELIYHDGAGWTVLSAGSANQVLVSNGTSLGWLSVGGGGLATEPSISRWITVPAHPGFDPGAIYNASVTLTNNNKDAQPASSSPYNYLYGLPGQYTGKKYFEFKIANTSFASVGVCGASGRIIDLDSGSPGNFGERYHGQIGYSSGGAVKAIPFSGVGGAVTLATYATFANNDILSFALDIDAALLWVRVNAGNWNNSGTANPATGVGGLAVPMLFSGANNGLVFPGCNLGNTSKSTMRLLSADFTQTVPSGFSQWGA